MKFGQILVKLMTNISKSSLTQLWKLGTTSKSFNDFIEIAV